MIVQPAQSQPVEPRAETLLAAPAGRTVFRLEAARNDRMAGSVPVWGEPRTPQEEVVQTLAAQTSKLSPETGYALALAPEPEESRPEESFGFFDLIDMINPLQHIPIISTVYRAFTGDEIKPIAQIVGGAVFGGPLGAAGGVANAIVQAETGRDIGENIFGFIRGDRPSPAEPDTTIALADLSYRVPRYND